MQSKKYKIIEIKDGVYLQYYEESDYQEYTFNLTTDLEKAFKFDPFQAGLRNIAEKTFGVVKILIVTYDVRVGE